LDESITREFRLSQPANGYGVCCDKDGVYVDGIPLLKRARASGGECWVARNCSEISEYLGAYYGLPIDVSSKSAGLHAVARALNAGDIARAQILAVHLDFPNSPALLKSCVSRDEIVRFIRELYLSRLIKQDWDPDEHPRWPAGSPDSQGGEFAPKGEDGESDGTAILDGLAYHPLGDSTQLDDGVYRPDSNPAEVEDVGDPRQLLLNRLIHDRQVMREMAWWRKKGFIVVPSVTFEDPRNHLRIVADYAVSLWVPDPDSFFAFPKPEPVLVRDVKTGDGGLQDNQKIVYPYILNGGAVIPRGFNAWLAGFYIDETTYIGRIFSVGKDMPSTTIH
jgi:hypothetical protein